MKEKPKILYVDDDLINIQLFRINNSDKYEVFTADNGISGLEVIDNNPDIAVVLTDMKMPGMDGIEFAKKAKENYPSIKFYILTGFEITKAIQEAIDSKLILKYFTKPFNMLEIATAIKEAVG